MSADQISDEILVEYLLGALSDEEAHRIEERYFTDDEFEDRLANLERDLIDSYVSQELPPGQRQRFETHFLTTESRARKLTFARTLHAHQSASRDAINVQPAARQVLSWLSLPVKAGEFGRPAVLRVAAILLVASGVAFVLWSISSNRGDLREGLQALGQAYNEARPSEYRISGLPYAPADVVRGTQSEKDSRYRELAERLLIKAAAKHPDARSQDALGKLYLAEGRTDQAISEFRAALSLSPESPSPIYNDLGAALLQRAGQLRPRQSGDDPAPEKQALDEALRSLDRALEANQDFGDAIFNRALCYERMALTTQAQAEWERYLQVDPHSGWALEAKEHLRHLSDSEK
ncbi:MAG TPA: hypothetical protein VI756_24110 [Blastocatellia bacterium]